MHFGLTSEQRALQDMVRKFAAAELAPGYAARQTAARIDRAVIRRMGTLGLIAPELPEDCGGHGADRVSSGIIIEEIARGDFNAAYIQLLACLCGQVLAGNGSQSITRPWLRRLTAGEAVIALALTEPAGGSDAARLSLHMRKERDHYVLNGEKASISMADQADAAVVFARSGSPDDGARGISALLVPLDLKGISRTRFADIGQHAVGRGSIFFDAVEVPADHLLGAEGAGFRQVLGGFDFSRALIALQCLAPAALSLEETWAWAGERKAFGQPLSAFQGVSHRLAELETHIEAARLLCFKTLWLKDQGRPHSAEAAMCKWWAPRLAFEAIHQCLLFHGHMGYSRDLPFEQRLRDVLGLEIGDGTAEIMKTIIARQRAGRHAVPY
jgi:cyclohexanecarboxyl-CoA dehydrogenase